MVATEKLFEQGNIVQTENPLDVALQGPRPVAPRRPATPAPRDSPPFGIIQGAVESSNVNVVEELVNMIETQRAYEMNAKSIETTDEMLRYVSNNL